MRMEQEEILSLRQQLHEINTKFETPCFKEKSTFFKTGEFG